tara:strand:- start:180 stop:332 length:153 start_codon:yes stop_codon:yes gene_type:complete
MHLRHKYTHRLLYINIEIDGYLFAPLPLLAFSNLLSNRVKEKEEELNLDR